MIVVMDSAPTEMLATTLMSRHQRSDDPAGSFFFFLLCATIRHFLRRRCPDGVAARPSLANERSKYWSRSS